MSFVFTFPLELFEYEAWNQLTLLGSYSNPVFRDRRLYPNVIQAGVVIARTILEVMHGFIRKFQWKIVYLVGEVAGNGFTMATTGVTLLEKRLRMDTDAVVHSVLVDISKDGNAFEAVLIDIRKVARGKGTSIDFGFTIKIYKSCR